MVLAVLDELRGDDAAGAVTVLTPLAAEDRRVADTEGVDVVAFGPVQIVLAVVGALLCRLTGGRISGGAAVAAIHRCDAVADVSGISFVDGRGPVTLAYNVLLVLPALLLGRPVVKVSQAMGPFELRSTRLAARWVLPRMAGLLARGARTQEHLEQLGVPGDGRAGDVAFLMQTTEADAAWAETQASAPFVAVSPSQVVADQAAPLGIDYLAHVVRIVDRLTEHHDVVLVAHSARPGQPAGRLNDVPLCEDVLAAVQRPDRVRLAPVDASPRQLRALIGRADVLVASRFHAMISGLATVTPVLVVGWSHKYREVLDEFGCAHLASDFREVDPDTTAGLALDLVAGRDEAAAELRTHLPAVMSSARRSLDVLQHAISRSAR